MGTIVQEYGPIYGEAVNGTVSGRPNGSYYVPIINTIQMSLNEDYRYIHKYGAFWFICNSSGVSGSTFGVDAVAQSQDLASHIEVDVFSDAECTTKIGYVSLAAGNFNIFQRAFNPAAGEDLDDYTTVYLRAQLVNNSVAVATSDTIAVDVVS